MQELDQTPGGANGQRPLRKMLILTALLAAVWLLWVPGCSSRFSWVLGLFSCLLTVWILARMRAFSDETFTFRFGPRLVPFWAWLGKEIILSSLQVARVVLAPKLRVSPRVVVLDVSDFSPADQVLLGNSITLTPGTLTLDVHHGRLLAHALTEAGAASLEAGDMQRRVAALRGS